MILLASIDDETSKEKFVGCTTLFFRLVELSKPKPVCSCGNNRHLVQRGDTLPLCYSMCYRVWFKGQRWLVFSDGTEVWEVYSTGLLNRDGGGVVWWEMVELTVWLCPLSSGLSDAARVLAWSHRSPGSVVGPVRSSPLSPWPVWPSPLLV